MFPRIFFTGAILAFSAVVAFPQTLAFPGALGYGAYATGGRGGTVYHVTNLNDSGTGSFRDAVSHSGRIIVFDIGGHVTLQSAISCSGNLTIAGQTAPGGICFDAGEISFSSRANLICRYIRIRPGSSTSSVNDDGLGMYQTTNAIFDHVSVGYGPYDNIDAVGANNLSFQNCIDANPIGQQFGAHIENVNANCSWHYNLFINSHNRNPLEKIDDTFINNVLYNCNAGYTTHTSTRFKHDIVNNYFVSGPAFGGSSDFPWYQVDKNQSIYYSGNLYDGNDNGTLDGSTTTPYWYQGTGTVLTSPWSSWTAVIPTVSAPLAWRYDVSASGAFPRDDVDSLIISQTKSLGSGNIGTGTGTAGPGTGLYTSQTQNGLSNNGYGSFTGGTAPSNFSGDGIADYWKLALNLYTNISYPLTNTLTGYTLLENYLNFLAAPHAVTQTNTPVLVDLAQFTAGFPAGATFSLTNSTNGTVTLVNGTNANFVPNADFSGLGTFTFTVNDNGLALSAPVAVCITPVVPPASASGFNGAIEVVATNAAASVVVPPNNLLWHGDGTVNTWNTSVSNWLNNAATSKYKDGDIVTFDDTGSISPAINLSATVSPGSIFFNDNQNYTLSGVGALSGAASLSKTGSGILTVNTTNSGFSGAITVNGGTFVVGPSASVGSGNITLSGGATFTTSFGGALVTVPGAITVAAGDSAVLASGPAQLGNEYSGNIISGDTNSVLTLSNGVSFDGSSSSQFSGFTGTIIIPAGATLRFALASSGNTFGSLNPTFLINGTLQPRNPTNTILLGALNGSGQVTGTQNVTNAAIGFTLYNIGGNNQNAVFNGIVASNTASLSSFVCLVKTGTGTQTLNGNNTFTGTNTIMAGALIMNGTNQPSLTTIFTNATLGGIGTINGSVRINSGGILAPGLPGTGAFGTFTINGNLTNNSPVFNFDLSSSPAGSNDLINMTGTLALTGPQMFNFNLASNALGDGTYNLIQGATNSTASGVTLTNNLPGNTRQVITLYRPPAGSNPSYIQLIVSGNAGSLLWQGTNGTSWDTSTTNWFNGTTADQYYNLDTVTFDDTAATATPSLAAGLQPAAILVTNNSLAYTFGGSGNLTGTGPLIKTGSGTLTVATVNNSYSGSITVNGGTLAVASGDNLGSGLLTLGNGTTLALPGNGGSVALGNPVFVPAGQTASITSGVPSSSLSGNFSSGNSATTLYINGSVSFGGGTSAQLDGFTGTINLQSGGAIRYSYSTGTGNTFGSFAHAMVINGTLQPRNAGNTIQLGAFTGSGTLAGQATQPASGGGTGTTTYLVGGNNTSASFAGTIIDSNPTNITTLYKIGTGTLALSGNSSYTGGTTISAGTLLVSNLTGSATGSGDLEVFSGATLTGNGIIGSSTTIDNGATLAPGSPTGLLTISNNLTLNDNSLVLFGLGTNSDVVSVSGDLFLTGQLQVSNNGGFGVGAYTLFTCGGALSIGNLVLASAPAGFNYSFNTNTPGVVKLIVAPTTPPNFKGLNLSTGNLTLAGSNGVPLGNYLVLQSSNLMDWTTVATNQFDTNGGFNFTTNIPTGSPQNFFRLQLQ
jgi:autotransporter-associated beta strand protein